MSLAAAMMNIQAFLRSPAAEPYEDGQPVATSPLVPPDGGSPVTITVGDLRRIVEAHALNRWNIEEDGTALVICRGLHEKGEPCEVERYVLQGPSDSDTEHFAGRMQHWLDEAQRLALLVRALGGDPDSKEPPPAAWLDTPIPEEIEFPGMTFGKGARLGTVIAAASRWKRDSIELHKLLASTGPARYRPDTADFPNMVIDIAAKRLAEIIDMWERQDYRMPDRGQIAFLIRMARAYMSWPEVDAATRERARICKALGCVDKPGVPLEFVLKLIQANGDMHHRIVELIRSWDPATPTERQELDRMRRGWGPSSPTERMQRRKDVNGCIQALTGALTELAVPEEDMEALGDEANAYIEAAHDRLQKHYTAILAISSELSREPQEWPDIRAAEERGALAMRRILEERVSGLRILTETCAAHRYENSGVTRACFAVRDAPLPRDYHGSARDDVAKILAGGEVKS